MCLSMCLLHPRINIATESWSCCALVEAAACLILAEDSFMAVALRAFKHKNIGMLKASRHERPRDRDVPQHEEPNLRYCHYTPNSAWQNCLNPRDKVGNWPWNRDKDRNPDFCNKLQVVVARVLSNMSSMSTSCVL